MRLIAVMLLTLSMSAFTTQPDGISVKHHTRHHPHYGPNHRAAFAWAALPSSKRVAFCESGGQPGNKRNPSYRGKWQMGFTEWRRYGGPGRDPADATEREQDYRAWLLWRARGWQPWTCGYRAR